ncbi:MAG: amidohydrolase [Desulfovibrio sp.]|jgi:5-methylthioadenosine/S-adenosylhomocysteine deaminase|nr:amidohydrolase [Desulfovibrio sp.]
MRPALPCDLLVTADVMLTQDDERRVVDDAAVAVTAGRIAALGSRGQLSGFIPAQTLHLGRALLMPGLINAHTHVAMTFFRGLADDLPLMQWLMQYIFPREKRLTADIVELGALLGCAEMIRTGTTAFLDMYLIEDAVTSAVDASGLRCVAGEGIFAFPSPAYGTAEEGLALVEAQTRRWQGHSRIRTAITPHTVFTTTPRILEDCRDLARKLGLPLHMHLAETPEETDTCLATHGKRPLAYCRELDLIGPDVTFAHVVDVTEEELDMLAANGVRVVHNPKSNMKLASGVAPVAGMVARGMLPGLGTDGAASNNSLNMFGEMSACALLHKVYSRDPTVLPARTVLDLATRGGAASMGWPELGRLITGGPADMLALDLCSPNFQPLHDLTSHLVYAASGYELRLSMVEGNILYHDGRWMTLDYPLLLSETRKLKQWVQDNAL